MSSTQISHTKLSHTILSLMKFINQYIRIEYAKHDLTSLFHSHHNEMNISNIHIHDVTCI